MVRTKFTSPTDPVVLVDAMEKRRGKWSALAGTLLENENIKTVVKDAAISREYLGEENYSAWGDFIIVFPEESPVHPGGCIVGIERKSFSDAYDSTVSGRMNDQLAELMGKCDGKAIVLIEPFKSVPKNLGKIPAYRYKKAVHTKARKLSFVMPVWWPQDTEQAATWIKDLMEHGWNYELEGRGWKVKRQNGKIKVKATASKAKKAETP